MREREATRTAVLARMPQRACVCGGYTIKIGTTSSGSQRVKCKGCGKKTTVYVDVGSYADERDSVLSGRVGRSLERGYGRTASARVLGMDRDAVTRIAEKYGFVAAAWPPLSERYPYVACDDALIAEVNSSVPRSWPDDVRADVCQEILCDIVAGGDKELILSRTQEYRKRYYKQYPILGAQRYYVSLDARVPGSSATWDERLEG